MIAANLYADLTMRGVSLGISDDGRALTFKAPQGVLDDGLRSAMKRHRDALLDFVMDVEERAALISDGQGDREETRRRALHLVPFGTATPDGQMYLRDLAEHHPAFVALNVIHAERFGCPVQIIEVRRVA